MNSRSITLGVALAAAMFSCPPASADAPINLAASRPDLAAAPGRQAVILPDTLRTVEAARRSHGPLVSVCATFPRPIFLDGAGNVYQQPVETDTQGHERPVGLPVPLASQKQVGGATPTAAP